MSEVKYRWTSFDLKLMHEHYDGSSAAIDLLVQRLGFPRDTIRQKAIRLGLTRQWWTREEERYLEKRIALDSMEDIAKHLKRTVSSIERKATRLGTNKRNQEQYNLHGLCEALGCSNRKVERWIEQGWLKGARRNTKKPDDIWYFHANDIRTFIFNHPDQLDQKRFDWLWVADILSGHGLEELSLPGK